MYAASELLLVIFVKASYKQTNEVFLKRKFWYISWQEKIDKYGMNICVAIDSEEYFCLFVLCVCVCVILGQSG